MTHLRLTEPSFTTKIKPSDAAWSRMEEYHAQLAVEELLTTLEDAPVGPEVMNAMAALSGAIGHYAVTD